MGVQAMLQMQAWVDYERAKRAEVEVENSAMKALLIEHVSDWERLLDETVADWVDHSEG